jgi:hypothetical protein
MPRLLRAALAVLLALVVAATGIEAKPLFLSGGHPQGAGGGGEGGGVAQACDGGSSVCAQFQSGQTFVTWTDMATGAAGNNWRYSVYRSTSPITSGNYGSATLIASYVLNNSGQLVGGNPNTGGANFTQANRQSAVQPMVALSDLGTPLAAYTGLQVYTALGTADAYYAVVANSQIGGGDTYIGSVGAIAESVGTPAPVKYADSTRQVYGHITTSSGKAMVFTPHASSSGGGPATNGTWGDYWTWWLTTGEGWQDGRQTPMDVLQDTNLGHFPSLDHAIQVSLRDTIWDPLGTAGMETLWLGLGLTPNPLVGAANKLYPSTSNGISRMLNWAIDHYGVDRNQIHWGGQSMGAWGGAMVGMRMASPKFSSLTLTYPIWRLDLYSTGSYWPGLIWTSVMPFKATVHAAPSTLGTDPAAIQFADGTTFGGTGGWADMPTFIAANPGTDLPVTTWTISKDDANLSNSGPASFQEELDALAAFQSAKRGHFFVWNMGAHDTTGMGAINCDSDTTPDNGVCYSRSLFKLNLPYLAFSSSSIDDNPGTATRDAFGVMDGASVGCINCGFTWNITTDTTGAFNFTVGNNWMSRSPTISPQTTLTGSIASSGTGTVTVTDGSVFQSVAGTQNIYFLVGGTEIIKVTSRSGNTLTYNGRGALGTNPLAHSSGEAITQYISQPTGPNGGPYGSMTGDVTPRRRQAFLPTNGAIVSCIVTPFGGSPSTLTPTVADGLFTLPVVPINATGITSVACS